LEFLIKYHICVFLQTKQVHMFGQPLGFLCLKPDRRLELIVHPDVPATDQLAGCSPVGFLGARAHAELAV
jgi:hypothetical protein